MKINSKISEYNNVITQLFLQESTKVNVLTILTESLPYAFFAAEAASFFFSCSL